jgi:UDP-glucose 4-epimerase
MNKVLITGVAGLLGSRLADWIIENNLAEVVGIDDLSGGYIENVNTGVEFHKINLHENTEAVDSLFENKRFDYVFHFAAYAAEGLSPFIREYNYKNNLIATTKLINNAIRHDTKRFVFTSTMAVYGANEPPFRESFQPAPIDPYGIAKYACEMDIQVAGEQHGMDWCIIRPHNVYGAKQNIWDKYRNVLGIWMYNHLNGKPITIYGDGNQTRAFSYIDDCVPYFWMCAVDPKASKQIFNIGGDDYVTINEAANLLIDIVGDAKKQHLEARHEVKHAWVTHDKIRDMLGYRQKTSLREGLAQMWEWAKKQPMRERRLWEKYELDVGVYDFWKIK